METNGRDRFARTVLGALLLAALLSLAAPSPTLAATTCTGSLGAVKVKGDLVVPAEASCLVQGADVTGNAIVEPGASLEFLGGVIRGNVAAQGHGFLILHDLEIRGNVTAEGGTFGDLGIFDTTIRRDAEISGNNQSIVSIAEATFRGNLVIVDNRGDPVVVLSNDVRGSLTFSNNTQVFGGFDDNLVSGNVVRGDLVCVGNDPAPGNEGVPNDVRGSKIGQCESL